MTQPKADVAGVSSLLVHAFHHCMRVLASPALINRWLNPYNWLLNTHLEREGVGMFVAARVASLADIA